MKTNGNCHQCCTHHRNKHISWHPSQVSWIDYLCPFTCTCYHPCSQSKDPVRQHRYVHSDLSCGQVPVVTGHLSWHSMSCYYSCTLNWTPGNNIQHAPYVWLTALFCRKQALKIYKMVFQWNNHIASLFYHDLVYTIFWWI